MDKYYHIITYGCQMNEHDSENIASMLEDMGYIYSEEANNADILVMNTCSVRDNADKRFFGAIGQFKKYKRINPDFIMCVCGCMPQQDWVREYLREHFSWVDVIFGTQNIQEFSKLLRKRIVTGKKQIAVVDNSDNICEGMHAKRLHKHKALVNITYGCNNFCTYCIVPYTRGREKSRLAENILAEIEGLVADGVKEVMLLGQNVDSYMDVTGVNFPRLLHAINEIHGLERIRFMTSHPKDISDEMIECFRKLDKLCHNIHLPLQSGSDEILRRMNRHYDTNKYMQIISKLRDACPDITISTDIIVGFPGESEDDFLSTLELVSKVRFDSAFTFIFSPRKGTPAAGYDNQIPEDVKHERFDRLVDTINSISLEKNSLYLGTNAKVLVDGFSKNDLNTMSGRTDGFKLVNFDYPQEINPTQLIGEVVDVCIDECKTFSLEGHISS